MKNFIRGAVLLIGGVAIGVASTLATQNYVPTWSLAVKSHASPNENKIGGNRNNDIFSSPFFSQDPLEEMRKMQESMRRGFDDDQDSLLGGMGGFFDNPMNGLKIGGQVRIENREDDKLVIYEVIGDGIDEKSINVKVSDGMVTVSGRIDQKSTNESDDSQSIYPMTSSFNQSFSVPHDVDADNVKMEHEDGKIILKFPKVQNSI